jgi:hypothetical protein
MLANTYLVKIIVIFIEHVLVMDHRLKISGEVDLNILVFAARDRNTEYRLIS